MTAFEFENCNFSNLTSVSMGTFNTVTSVSFAGTSLAKATALPSLVSSALTTLSYADVSLPSLTGFALYGYSYPNLATLDFEGAVFSELTYFYISSCTALTSVNLRDTDFSNCSIFKFENCSALPSITLYGMHALRIFEDAFSGCSSLTEVNFVNCSYGPDDWLTTPQTSWNNNAFTKMFKNCTALTSVDLSCFASTKRSYNCNFTSMFEGCTSLTSVTLPAV